MIRPPRGAWAFIIRNAPWVHRKAPVRLVSTTRRQASTLSSSSGLGGAPVPALLKSRSRRPQRRCTASNTAATDGGEVTSAGTTSADARPRFGRLRPQRLLAPARQRDLPARAEQGPGDVPAKPRSRPGDHGYAHR